LHVGHFLVERGLSSFKPGLLLAMIVLAWQWQRASCLVTCSGQRSHTLRAGGRQAVADAVAHASRLSRTGVAVPALRLYVVTCLAGWACDARGGAGGSTVGQRNVRSGSPKQLSSRPTPRNACRPAVLLMVAGGEGGAATALWTWARWGRSQLAQLQAFSFGDRIVRGWLRPSVLWILRLLLL
jgi:hypothetical protein